MSNTTEVMQMAIPTAPLASGYTIPYLGLGTWRLVGDDCARIVRQALDLGYTHIDTADMYGNHEQVGAGIRGVERSSFFLTTKVGPEHLRHDDTIAVCERSLRELGTDYLDMLLIHWPNADVPMAETFEAMADLTQRGLIRSAGVSNFVAARLDEAVRISPVAICTNQVEFHPLLFQQSLLSFCGGRRVKVTAYSPLARTEALGHPVILAVSEEIGRTPAQVCLNWLVQKAIIVIPKASSEHRLRENMDIFDWSLTPEQQARIDAIGEQRRLIRPDIAEF
ncbi:MAG TPA: aldo/keto reductase [Armatimonadetes bacterium]|jgi:diketogulonate reductase-like aldo/keto reductase|nr:aldo/keto reductase [Armatimonadota bacterium]